MLPKIPTQVMRFDKCQWCGASLAHKLRGRPRQFCDGNCSAKYLAALREWAQQSVDAILAGQPEPKQDFGHESRLMWFYAQPDGRLAPRNCSASEFMATVYGWEWAS